MTAPLRLRAVKIAVHGRPLLGPLTLEVAAGEVVTVMGPSGCGKSSLLSYLCGTLDGAVSGEGEVVLGERILNGIPAEARRIGILFQDDLLFPHLTVGENLAFGLSPRVKGAEARRAHIDQALAEADLAGFAGRDPATLSGGQRARAALMRVLLSEPGALLLDEPFGRLDADLRAQMRRFVFSHAKAKTLPVLLVSHDRADAEAGDRTVKVG